MKTNPTLERNYMSFLKISVKGICYFLGIFILLLLAIWLSNPDKYQTKWMLALAGGTGILLVLAVASYKTWFSQPPEKGETMHTIFFSGIRLLTVILLAAGLWGMVEIFQSSDCGSCAVFKAIGLAIVIIWACIFLTYFIWGIYFFNINLGLTDKEWEKIDDEKEKRQKGDLYAVDVINEEPIYNPFKDETFGLPPGTVRGMIAFTLLFGALAMLVVSIGMENEIDPSSMFWDQYEFFKTAFLMMIAFYFGSRSLEYLKDRHKPQLPQTVGDKKQQAAQEAQPGNVDSPPINKPVDPMQPQDPGVSPGTEPKVSSPSSKQTISGKDFDPMQP